MKNQTVTVTDEQFNNEFDPKLLQKQVTVTDHSDIVNNISTTKSDKIRQLLSKGLKRGEVAKLLNIKYQHVRNVEITPIKRK